MPVRDVVEINEDLCDGCGDCVTACAEGAIAIIDGKARLVSDIYCDGLGACLGHCPQGAITVTRREADDFDEAAVAQRSRSPSARPPHLPSRWRFPLWDSLRVAVVPGSRPAMRTIEPPADPGPTGGESSQLRHWPVQLHLVPPTAPFFSDADVLLAADCVAFAVADFHRPPSRGTIAGDRVSKTGQQPGDLPRKTGGDDRSRQDQVSSGHGDGGPVLRRAGSACRRGRTTGPAQDPRGTSGRRDGRPDPGCRPNGRLIQSADGTVRYGSFLFREPHREAFMRLRFGAAAGVAALSAIAVGRQRHCGGPAADVSVESTHLEVGPVIAGTTAVATFVFRNDGDKEIRILRAAPS